MDMYILLVILQAMKTQILFICNYDGKISIFVLIGFDHLQVIFDCVERMKVEGSGGGTCTLFCGFAINLYELIKY